MEYYDCDNMTVGMGKGEQDFRESYFNGIKILITPPTVCVLGSFTMFLVPLIIFCVNRAVRRRRVNRQYRRPKDEEGNILQKHFRSLALTHSREEKTEETGFEEVTPTPTSSDDSIFEAKDFANKKKVK